MSQSVSISFGLFFLSTLLITSIIYTTMNSSQELLNNAEEAENDRWEKRLHTKIELLSAQLSNDSQQISLYVKNTGDIQIIDLPFMDLFSNCTLDVPSTPYVNETWIPFRDLSPSVSTSGFYWIYSFLDDNHYNPLLWDPNETLNITIYSPNPFNSGVFTYHLATPLAVSHYFTYNTTKI